MKLSPAESWITLCRKGTFLQWRTSGRYLKVTLKELISPENCSFDQ
ncbi:rCG37901 [Rattus norvegicus]|uniref:RCG37901 n=1 Tax=Rattus norvegicus TaxID=10116 RepID=A6K5R4_RAT|nr:rCG37901 [Rattus norvegicus]